MESEIDLSVFSLVINYSFCCMVTLLCVVFKYDNLFCQRNASIIFIHRMNLFIDMLCIRYICMVLFYNCPRLILFLGMVIFSFITFCVNM